MDLSEDIRAVIDEYLAAHRSRSLATLARVSGVSYTTLRRFWQREGTPTAEPVLKVLDATLSGEAKAEFLRRHFPELARSLASFSDARGQGERRAELKDFVTREPHGLILLLAANTGGTTLHTVRRLCGEVGTRAVEDLRTAGLLMVDEETGRVSTQSDRVASEDADTVLGWIRTSLNYFDRRQLGTSAARLCHASAAVSAEGLRRIHEIASEAIERIVEIKEDPRFAGPIPFFYDVVMNVYDRAPIGGAEAPDPAVAVTT